MSGEGKKKFQDEWLSDPQFKEWLKKLDNLSKLRCTLCNKTGSLSTSGRSALSIHASGDKHKEIVEKRLNFFNKSKKKSAHKEPEQLDSSSLSSTCKQLTLDGKINNNEVTYAKIDGS